MDCGIRTQSTKSNPVEKFETSVHWRQNSILMYKQIYANKMNILLLNYYSEKYETVVKHLQFQGKYQSLLKIDLFLKNIFFITWWSSAKNTKYYMFYYSFIDLRIWFLFICCINFTFHDNVNFYWLYFWKILQTPNM